MKIRNIIVAFTFLAAISANSQTNSVAELPAKAQDFLRENFSKLTVYKVVKDAEGSKKGYKAILSDNTEVEFWKGGNWREIDGNGKAIPTFFILGAIQDYVKNNYSNEKITQIEYHPATIDIELTNKVNLEFDTNGKFIRIDK